MTKTPDRNYDFKTYVENFLWTNMEKWAKLGLKSSTYNKNKKGYFEMGGNDVIMKTIVL